MKNKLLYLLSLLVLLFSACNSQFNKDIMYGTVGNKLEKIAPGEVAQIKALSGDGIVKLTWVNPTDKDFYGVKISVTSMDIDAAIPNPITLSADNPEDIPEKYDFHSLTNNRTYVFKFETFDRNLNYSNGQSLMAKPDIENKVEKLESATAITGDKKVTVNWVITEFADLAGVSITYRTYNNETKEYGEASTINFPKNETTGIIQNSYTFSDLINNITYEFALSQYDSKGVKSPALSCQATPSVGKNLMEISIDEASTGDGTVRLDWTNLSTPEFYGIQISAVPADGSLLTPVYFLKKDDLELPTTYLATGLTNNTSYKFLICTLDRDLNLSSGSSTTAKPAPTSNHQDIQNFRAIAGNGYVDLYWKAPEDISLLEYYELYISPGLKTITFDDLGTTSYRANGLENGTSYSFTIRTFDISKNPSKGVAVEARPNSGSSGIYDHPDLIYYMNSVHAYDFGYAKNSLTKKFTFSSTTQIDLTKTSIKNISGKSGVFTVVSYENITDGAESLTSVSQGEEFEIVLKYTPTKYDGTKETASWDEADLFIGGVDELKIRLLGSNYPQPKSITSNELRMWLRSDLISASDLTDEGKVKRLPDYSGNNFDAYCFDKTYSVAPKYVDTGKVFNGIPYIDFNTTAGKYSQLISTGAPIVEGKRGNTTFVVYKFGAKTDSTQGQGVISSNYGTAFPTIYSSHRYYNDTGYYITNDYKFGIAIKGYGLAGTLRWACISNDITNDDNRLLVINAPTAATGLSKQDRIYSQVLSTCAIFDATIDPNYEETGRIPDYPRDYPSNIRMMINGKERLLAYFDTMSNTTQALNTNSNALKGLCSEESSWLLRKDGLYTYGIYGRPFGDGKGHRYGSLSDVPKPANTEAATYNAWLEAASKAGGLRENPVSVNGKPEYTQQDYKRKYDTAFRYNSPAGFNAAISDNTNSDSASSYSNIFSNWIDRNSYRNGTITTMAIGADIQNCNYTEIQVAEVFVFDGALSEEEIKLMNDYIYYRYNISDISDNPADYYD